MDNRTLLGTGINKQNGPGVVDDDDPFGERLQKGAYRDISLEKSGSKSYLPLDSQFLFLACLFLLEVGCGRSLPLPENPSSDVNVLKLYIRGGEAINAGVKHEGMHLRRLQGH